MVEGSGEILRQTDKVPVIDDELITTRASTQRDLLPSHVQNSKSEDKGNSLRKYEIMQHYTPIMTTGKYDCRFDLGM